MRPDKKDSPRNKEGVHTSETAWVSDITEASAIAFHDSLMKQFDDDPFKPIVIHIDSYGGEVDALFSMLDTMDSIRSMAPPEFKIFTVAKGKACSAGAVLLSYGDYRFAVPRTRIMIHQVVGGVWGSHPANEVEFKEVSRMNNELLTILKKRCKLKKSLKEFKEMLSHNLYFTPEQAKEFGLIDIIGYPKVVEQKMYEIRVINGEPPPKEAPRAKVSIRSKD